MKRNWILAFGLWPALMACEPQASGERILQPLGADGREYHEPVFYNGKFYDMHFRFEGQNEAYVVRVTGQAGRPLRANPGNAQNSEKLGLSALSHFACPTKRRAERVGQAPAHDGHGYVFYARCGG